MVELSRLDEETRALLRQIVRRQGYRLLKLANIAGHGLKHLPDIEEKRLALDDLRFRLTVLREIERLHRDLDGGDLEQAVLERMDRIPYPESRLELAACLAFTGRAERVSAASYLDSSCAEFAALARTLYEAPREHAEEEGLFAAFCREPGCRAQAERHWSRWTSIAIVSLGRPGTRGDKRAVELGLRTKHAAGVVHDFLDAVEPLRAACGLALPPLDLDVELPDDVRARFAPAGQTS